MLNNTSVLITGGTGSFGKAAIKYLLENYKMKRIVIFSRDELKQSELQQQLSIEDHPCLRYFIGDVRDVERLKQAMSGVDYVIHAAAMKQVPASEYNPFECVRTNIIGAENVINAAIYSGVKRVIALSTDKAANPINLYGATKLASDKLFIAANHMSGHHGTRFSVVRYGNVVGSRGSVIPFFLKCIANGDKCIPITDMRMTRFWVTLDRCVEFVFQNLDRMIGGETFVPKVPSMRLRDLAEALQPGCDIKVVGIRPGEKLHEVLIPVDDARRTVVFDDYYVIQPAFHWWNSTAFKDRNGGKNLDPEYEYRSDTNEQWLTCEQLREIVFGANKKGYEAKLENLQVLSPGS